MVAKERRGRACLVVVLVLCAAVSGVEGMGKKPPPVPPRRLGLKLSTQETITPTTPGNPLPPTTPGQVKYTPGRVPPPLIPTLFIGASSGGPPQRRPPDIPTQEYKGQRSVYVVVDKLGAGSFGTVIKVRDKTNGKLYALKLMQGLGLAAFDAEKEALEKIASWAPSPSSPSSSPHSSSHPESKHDGPDEAQKHLVHYVDELNGRTYGLVVTLAPGQPLEATHSLSLSTAPTIAMPRIRHIMLQLLQTVRYLHAHGLYHNDLKPENIMLDEANDDHVTIIDFGAADAEGASADSGTMLYKAPEDWFGYHLRGTHRAGGRDMYALGLIYRDLVLGVDKREHHSPSLLKVLMDEGNILGLHGYEKTERAVLQRMGTVAHLRTTDNVSAPDYFCSPQFLMCYPDDDGKAAPRKLRAILPLMYEDPHVGERLLQHANMKVLETLLACNPADRSLDEAINLLQQSL